jgi:SAM-dependent methyltransferase
MMSPERGVARCRGCDGTQLTSVLDLGEQPIANELGEDASAADPAFPLHLRVCQTCGLGQLGEFVPPERLFAGDYPYFSSVSRSWSAHALAYADQVTESLSLGPDDLVVEVASNDGYLLEHFARRGIQVFGVEPAAAVASVARAKGVPTVEAFFGVPVAEGIVEEHGHPRLVAANNVMAHVPDLRDFIGGLAALCGDDTLVTVENPSFAQLLTSRFFDTIYHEHFSYLSAHSVARAVAPFGLELFRVDALPTHGGSNRYWLGLRGRNDVEPSVEATVAAELRAGLLDPHAWAAFRSDSLGAVAGFRTWLDQARAAGRRVAGYGAAAKGNTLLNAAGARADDLVMVVDGSPLKQGKLLPGSKIPIRPPSELPPDIEDVLVLPWNLAAEIVGILEERSPGAQCWTAIPEMRRVT